MELFISKYSTQNNNIAIVNYKRKLHELRVSTEGYDQPCVALGFNIKF